MRIFATAVSVGAVVTAAVEVPDFSKAVPGFNPTTADNMNGEYVMSTTPGGTPGLFPKRYADYPGGVEAYDVLSPPMTTYYSQVWWAPLAPASFPDEMVKKYAGKQVVFVGWEIDQVQVTPSGEEISVPISASYNHHYNLNIIGAGSQFKKVMLDGPGDPRAQDLLQQSHGVLPYDQPHYIVEKVKDTAGPSSAFITSGNGGEYRKTYHGYAPGYGIILDSPTHIQVSPMQIDTWNREAMNISGPLPPKFVPGPLPRSSEAPEGAIYSGLLECPMTTRLTKVLDGTYTVQSGGQAQCEAPILTFQECYHAAATTITGANLVNRTGSDPSEPTGCTVRSDPSTSTVEVFFNKVKDSKVLCAAGAKLISGESKSLVNVAVSLDSAKDLATIEMSGPSDVWFAVGFGASAMADQPWTVVADGNGAVTERKIGGQAPNSHVAGTQLKASVTVQSNTVASGTRTVVVTRPLAGLTADYFTFNTSATDPTIQFINAVGSSADFGYHKDKIAASLTLLPTSAPGACVCPEAPPAFGQATGSLVYHPVANQSVDTGTGAVAFMKQKCREYPYTVLNEQKNPTCDIRYYQGGQWACHHKWSLLDADQEIPWTDQPLVFHHKWRVYVQPYNASYHTGVSYGFASSLLIGSPYEYDVPNCSLGNVPGCAKQNDTWIHTITGNAMITDSFASLNFHCHAPTCLSMAVYMCEEGVAMQDCNTTNGQLVCEQRPAYGGTNRPELNGTKFDEDGYVAIPDCFWGSSEFGLEAPVNFTGRALHMVKTANATYPHYGEMAGGQPFVLPH